MKMSKHIFFYDSSDIKNGEKDSHVIVSKKVYERLREFLFVYHFRHPQEVEYVEEEE